MSRVLPILFNTEMVRAILDGRKTVTRRVIKDTTCIIRPDQEISKNLKGQFELYNVTPRCGIPQGIIFKPPYQVGDIMYVRETWKIVDYLDKLSLKFEYEADGKISDFIDFTNNRLQRFIKYINKKGWCHYIHMPKEAARIFLRVTDVRVERLQEMKNEDFEKEGLENFCKKCSALFNDCDTCLNDGGMEEDFKELWNTTIKKSELDRYGWDANSWVWVIKFERCEKPEGWCK